LEAVNNPEDPAAGTRMLPFSRELWIERDDFMATPPRKFFRLAPGREVRLRYAYYVTCTGMEKDPASGEVTAVHCTYDPATRGGASADGRKVRGTIHWVSVAHAVEAEVRLYDRLFAVPVPDAGGGDFRDHLNPESLTVLTGCKLEPGLAAADPGLCYQFERLGYFRLDAADSRPGAPVFNRAVTLRDSWARAAQR
jgi:glutaminyl-tRNA synthetase